MGYYLGLSGYGLWLRCVFDGFTRYVYSSKRKILRISLVWRATLRLSSDVRCLELGFSVVLQWYESCRVIFYFPEFGAAGS